MKRHIPPTAPPELPTIKEKVINRIVVVMLFITMAGVGVLVFWGAQADDVIQINNAPVPTRIVKDADKGKDIVVLKVDFCKKSNVWGRARVSFVSEAREIFLPEDDERSAARCEITEFPILVPPDIPPDTYKVKFTLRYNINPLKQGVVEQFESVPFQIGKDESVKLPPPN